MQIRGYTDEDIPSHPCDDELPQGSGFFNSVPGLLLLALVLALTVGWTCILFIYAIQKVIVIAYDTGGHDAMAQWVGSADFLRILACLVLGGAAVGTLTHYLIPERCPQMPFRPCYMYACITVGCLPIHR